MVPNVTNFFSFILYSCRDGTYITEHRINLYIRVSTIIACTISTTPHDSFNAIAAKVRVFIGGFYIKKFPLMPPMSSRRCHCHCCRSKFAPPSLLLLPSHHRRCYCIARCFQSKPSLLHHRRCHIAAAATATAASSKPSLLPRSVVAAVLSPPLLPSCHCCHATTSSRRCRRCKG